MQKSGSNKLNSLNFLHSGSLILFLLGNGPCVDYLLTNFLQLAKPVELLFAQTFIITVGLPNEVHDVLTLHILIHENDLCIPPLDRKV